MAKCLAAGITGNPGNLSAPCFPAAHSSCFLRTIRGVAGLGIFYATITNLGGGKEKKKKEE